MSKAWPRDLELAGPGDERERQVVAEVRLADLDMGVGFHGAGS